MKTMLKIALIVLMTGILSCADDNGYTEGDNRNNLSVLSDETTQETSESEDINIILGGWPIPSDWDLTAEPFDPVIHAEQKAAWEALRISSYWLRSGYNTYFTDMIVVKVYPDGTAVNRGGEPVLGWRSTIDNIFDTIPDLVADYYALYGHNCSIRYNPTYHYPELFYENGVQPYNVFYVEYFGVLK